MCIDRSFRCLRNHWSDWAQLRRATSGPLYVTSQWCACGNHCTCSYYMSYPLGTTFVSRGNGWPSTVPLFGLQLKTDLSYDFNYPTDIYTVTCHAWTVVNRALPKNRLRRQSLQSIPDRLSTCGDGFILREVALSKFQKYGIHSALYWNRVLSCVLHPRSQCQDIVLLMNAVWTLGDITSGELWSIQKRAPSLIFH